MHERGYDVIYADFSPVAVAAFSRRNPGIPTVIADCRCLPFRDESIALVLSLGLLEHFEHETRRTIIQEKPRVARGYTLIDVPQTLSPMMLVKKTLMALGRWSYGEETQFTFSQLLREFRSAEDHFEVVGQYGRELVPLPRNVKNVFTRASRPPLGAYSSSPTLSSPGAWLGASGLSWQKPATELPKTLSKVPASRFRQWAR